MDIDPPLSHPPSQPSQNEGRIRTPLPSGPRPDKQLLPPLPGFDTFRADLQGSVDRILANPFRSRYAHVSVLMIRWQDDDDSETRSALEELARLFQEDYGYAVYVKPIPRVTDESRNPSLWLTNVLGEFLSNHDQRDCLKIFYYAGYCYLDPDRQPVLARWARHPELSCVYLLLTLTLVVAPDIPTLRPPFDGVLSDKSLTRRSQTYCS
jgi:hypothetical protein